MKLSYEKGSKIPTETGIELNSLNKQTKKTKEIHKGNNFLSY